MFEEICLVCGKHLKDDGRAYCSDDCQNSDLSSPSISSSSSALSSPSMGYAAGGDVPALVPSALGTALNMYVGRNGRYVSSSSASSASWSVDDDEESPYRYARREHAYPDVSDPLYDASSKSANYIYTLSSSALSYARRPSGTNNHSTVPHLQHRRLSSGSFSGHVQGFPRSAPMMSHASQVDDEALSDFASSSGDVFDNIDDADNHSEKDYASTRSKRNRASLPACFSLLKMSSPRKDFHASPVSSSSANTIARPSPPTPKLPNSTGLSHAHPLSSIPPQALQSTPRGRRREADSSRSSRRSGPSSPSRSRSRACHVTLLESPRLIGRSFREPQDFGDDLYDYPDVPRRGREPTRRNSSPPLHEVYPLAKRAIEGDRSRSGSNSLYRATRGRARLEDLGETGSDAPGYGNGRSGLVHRERGMTRVPL